LEKLIPCPLAPFREMIPKRNRTGQMRKGRKREREGKKIKKGSGGKMGNLLQEGQTRLQASYSSCITAATDCIADNTVP